MKRMQSGKLKDAVTVPALVSVVIPTYRHAATVADTLRSVFAQTYPAYEVIVVNDGSPDNTREVLEPFVQEGWIRYLEQENQGQAAARNRGFSEARGEFVSFLDDDDLWPKDKLEWQVEAMRDDPEAVLIYGGMRPFEPRELEAGASLANVVSEPGPSGEVFPMFRKRNWIVSPGQTLIRSEALEGIGGFNERIWGADDYDLYLRLSRTGRFLYEHRLSLLYRKHEGNASRRINELYRNCRRVRSAYHGFQERFNKDYWMGDVFMRRFYARQYRLAAIRSFEQGRITMGFCELVRGALIWPPILLKFR